MKSHGEIEEMLKKQERHLSFHTPGHKRNGWDITELSYSDNLACPTGVIARAEEEIAQILGAKRSFILTDGSTSGVHAMLYALKKAGVKSVAYSVRSHPSVKNGCEILGLNSVPIDVPTQAGIFQQPTYEQIACALQDADALLLTSPDYYGNFPDLESARALCEREKKPLLIDGAHGAHLHFLCDYAGKFADMWVDGVHKSLPALTQGAVVSCTAEWAEGLQEGVRIFRTSSPSYPIMASVEQAVKYPRNLKLERFACAFKRETGAVSNYDWTKILLFFGDKVNAAQEFLERHRVYPEFNDGNYLLFYLSPCSKIRHLKRLKRLLEKLPRGDFVSQEIVRGEASEETEWVLLENAAGKTCARDCGLFPPCIPLIASGEKITARAVNTLLSANGTFGLNGNLICVYQ